MEKLIEALTILLKYDNPEYPTHCEHDELMVLVDPRKVSLSDHRKLNKLGFHIHHEHKCFYSFKYGSA